jgi:hypothetical protein
MFRRKTAKQSPAGSEEIKLTYIGDRIVAKKFAEIHRLAAEREEEQRRKDERLRLVYDQIVLELRALLPKLAPFGVDEIHIGGEDEFEDCYFCPRVTEHITLLGDDKQILDLWISGGVSIIYRLYRAGHSGTIDLLSSENVGALVEDALSAIIERLAHPFRTGSQALREASDA